MPTSTTQATYPSTIDLSNSPTDTVLQVPGDTVGGNLGTAVTYIKIDPNSLYHDLVFSEPGTGIIHVRFGGPASNFNSVLANMPGFDIIGDASVKDGSTLNACDLNWDGILDLVITSQLGATISVLFVNSTLRNASSIFMSSLYKIFGPTGYSSGYTVACGNFYRQGFNSLGICAKGSNSLYFLNGNITSSTPTISLPNLGNEGRNITGKCSSIGFIPNPAEGLDDTVIGANQVNSNAGMVYYLPSKTIQNVTNLASVSNSTGGCMLPGLPNSQLGWIVSSTFYNGYPVMLLGGVGVNNFAGGTFVVPIKPGFCPTGTYLIALINGNNGCQILGRSPGDFTGNVLANLGDISWSGSNAFFIGGVDTGYIIFTNPSFCPTGTLYLANLGSNGIQLTNIGPAGNGISVSANPGDADGNGLPDPFVGSPGGQDVDPGFINVVFSEGAPILTINPLTLQKGHIVDLTSSNFSATYVAQPAQSANIPITINNIFNCYIALFNAQYSPLNVIIEGALNNNTVQVIVANSALACSFFLQIVGRLASTLSQQVPVNFIHLGTEITNSGPIPIIQGQTITLYPNQLSAINLDNASDNPDVIFYVIYQANCYVQQAGNQDVKLSSFLQSQLESGQIEIVHEGNDIAPILTLRTGDGTKYSSAQNVTFAYNPAPVLTVNQLKIEQGQRLKLTSSNLHASGVDITYNINSNTIQGGYIESDNAKGVEIYLFSDDEVENGTIYAVTDGTTKPFRFSVSASSGGVSTLFQFCNVDFQVAPIFLNVAVTVLQGKITNLNSQQLSATQAGVIVSSLIFNFNDITGGHYAFKNDTQQTPISNCTQSDVPNVIFISDGTPPGGSISVTDGVVSTSELIIYNYYEAPEITANFLSLTRDTEVIVTTNMLSATDKNTPEDELRCYPSILNDMDGQFHLYPAGPATDDFIFGQVRSGTISFMPHGPNAPVYNMTFCNNAGLCTTSSAIINFLNNQAAAASSSSSNYTNEIVGSSIGVAFTLGAFFFKLIFNYKLNSAYRTKINDRSARAGKNSSEELKFYDEIIAPVSRGVVETISTANLFGCRGTKDTNAYLDAIEAIVYAVHHEKVPLANLTMQERTHVVKLIVDEAYKLLVGKRTCSAVRTFFWRDVSPSKMLEYANTIASNVKDTFNHSTLGGARLGDRNEAKTSQVADSSDIELQPIKEEKISSHVETLRQNIQTVTDGLQQRLKVVEDTIKKIPSFFWQQPQNSYQPVAHTLPQAPTQPNQRNQSEYAARL